MNRVPDIIGAAGCRGLLAAVLVSCLSVAPLSGAAAVTEDTGRGAVKSLVLADRRTGRLVRRVVAENVIQPRVISPRIPGQPEPKPLRAGSEQVNAVVEEMAGRYEVDPLLVHAIIHVESAYNPFAISPKGAEGLMQLIPATARRMGVTNSFDTRANIEGGVKYLRLLLDRFSDLRHVLAGYNAGEEAVARYGGIPPYAETHDYVYRVGQRYGQLRRTARSKPAPVVAAAAKPEPEHRPLEAFVDPEGKLHLRTR